MIYSTDITIPVLCPINFSEPKETYFYPEQARFVGKIRTSQHIQFLITKAMFDSPNAIKVKCRHYKGWLSATEYTMTKTALGTAPTYWYADVVANMHTDLPNDWIGYIEIYFGTTLIAKSCLYERKLGNTNYFKEISYNNSKNDWNTVFGNNDFKLTIPCGFNPNDFSSKRKVENFQDQDIQNINIYAQPYDTEILTIGAPYGVPNWMYKKLNTIFACETIKVDGVIYRVAEGAELEKKDMTYEGLHILQIELQPINTYAQ